MSEEAARVMSVLGPARARFLGFAEARVGADAEDVLQAAMLRAALKAQSLRDPSLVVPWFYRILRHAIADHRAKKSPPQLELTEADEPRSEPPVDVCRCPMAVMKSLRPAYAEIVRRVDVDEEPLAECAAALGISPNHAAVRLHRGRRALRDALLNFCGSESMRACLDCSCDPRD